jgi:hypothetical protein
MNNSQVCERESVANTPLEPTINEYEYSAITGESVATARRNRLLRKGCPYVKLGALVRYRPEDVSRSSSLRAYIARNLRGNSAEVR